METGGPLAYVAIAGNCAGAVSVGDCVAAMLLQVDPQLVCSQLSLSNLHSYAYLMLQRALGMGGHVKYSGGQGKLAQAAAAASSGNQSVSAIGQVQILKAKISKTEV